MTFSLISIFFFVVVVEQSVVITLLTVPRYAVKLLPALGAEGDDDCDSSFLAFLFNFFVFVSRLANHGAQAKYEEEEEEEEVMVSTELFVAGGPEDSKSRKIKLKRLDLMEVQLNLDALIEFLSNDSFAGSAPSLLAFIATAIGRDYEPYRQLLLGLMYKARTLLYNAELSDLFCRVIADNAFNEIKNKLLLDGLQAFCNKSVGDASSIRLDTAVREALDTLPGRRPGGHRAFTRRQVARLSYDGGEGDASPEARDVPQLEDIRGGSLEDLPAVVVGAAIPDEHAGAHLRTQYELLRGDAFFQVCADVNKIREAVDEIGAGISDAKLRNLLRQKRHSGVRSVRAYLGNCCHGPALDSFHGLFYVFSLSKQQRVRERSFMAGNLVLCSASYFRAGEPIYVGVVRQVMQGREKCDVTKDRVFGVSFLSSAQDLSCGCKFEDYWRRPQLRWSFLEFSGYFRPYHVAMARLREMDQHIPLQSSILSGATDIPPGYIFGNAELDLGDCVVQQEGVPGTRFNVLDMDAWNERCMNWTIEMEAAAEQDDDLKFRRHVLDVTQRQALQHIFSHRVAIVQGTPGTGKTFIATKFVQILLHNNAVHRQEGRDAGPILCMALTNHAVDAFLEDILRMAGKDLGGEDDVIRLGAGSRNEALKKYQFHSAGPSRFVIDYVNSVQQYMSSVRDPRKLLQKNSGFVEFSTFVQQRVLCFADKKFRYDQDACRKLLQRVKHFIKDNETLLKEFRYALTPQSLDAMYEISNRLLQSDDRSEVEWGEELQEQLNEIHDLTMLLSDQPYFCCDLLVYHRAREGFTPEDAFDLWVTRTEFALGPLEISGADWDAIFGVPRNNSAWPGLSPETRKMLLEELEEEEGPTVAPTPEEVERNKMLASLGEEERQRRANAENQDDAMEMEVNTKPVYNHERVQEIHDFVYAQLETSRRTGLMTLPKDGRQLLRIAAIVLCRQEALSAAAALAESKEVQEEIKLSSERVTRRNGANMRKAKLIVGTTDSVMTNLAALHIAHPSVLVVEEAAEVLESHVLASMPRDLDHLVLIGDHKQLSPKVNERHLEVEKGLGVSLQERLILCGAPFVTLTMQRRMHPVISRIVHPYYARSTEPGDQPVEITDHPRTDALDEPRCVSTAEGRCFRTYLVGYDEKQGSREEELDDNLDSPFNKYECNLCSAVVRHLHQYHPTKSIIVLVPYTGQLLKMKGTLKDMMQTVLCRTVDDFQGEEADFVVLSLTRTKKPGFLIYENRACVALSRARMGCYVVGCNAIVSRACSIFVHFWELMKADGTLSTTFPGFCPTHQQVFRFSSETDWQTGKCRKVCGERLPNCSHCCTLMCHGTSHENVQCHQECGRFSFACKPPRPCDHRCTKECKDACGKCEVLVPYKCVDCGNIRKEKCYQTLDPKKHIVCRAEVVFTAEETACKHEIRSTCHDRIQLKSKPEAFSLKACQKKCEQHMPCGHLCPRKCHIGEDDDHKEQAKRCQGRRLVKSQTCSHNVWAVCSNPSECGTCTELCGKRKAETGCSCVLPCGHGGLCGCGKTHDKRCANGHTFSVDCEKMFPGMVCPKPCQAVLPCKHVCPGTCGECAARETALGCSDTATMVHRKCARACGKALPCGHVCSDGCGERCGPCQSDCNFRCGHPSDGCGGRHPCYACPARECNMPCQWNCDHHQCQLPCHIPCTRPMCDERCGKLLPCGHQCMGLCGEVCPPLCSVCYRGDAGEEAAALHAEYAKKVYVDHYYLYEEDVEHFCRGELELPPDMPAVQLLPVELKCCGWLMVVGYLDQCISSWLEGLRKKDGTVKLGVPSCPLCKRPLMPDMYRRQSHVVKACHASVTALNKKMAEHRAGLHQRSLDAVDALWRKLCRPEAGPEVMRRLHGLRQLRDGQTDASTKSMKSKQIGLHEVEKLVEGMKADIDVAVDDKNRSSFILWCASVDLNNAATAFIARSLQVYLETGLERSSDTKCEAVRELLARYVIFLLEQQQEGSSGILISLVAEWLCCLVTAYRSGTPSDQQKLLTAQERALRVKNLPDSPKECVKLMWNQTALENLLVTEGRPMQIRLGFTKTLMEIHRAMSNADPNIQAGSWFQCPNGHLYLIADCGGAMERGKCPDCGEVVGGEDHAVQHPNGPSPNYNDKYTKEKQKQKAREGEKQRDKKKYVYIPHLKFPWRYHFCLINGTETEIVYPMMM
eukprot:gene8275-5794_t